MNAKLKGVLAAIAVCAFLFGYGCIFNPDQGGGGNNNGPPVVYKELTQKEDVVDNLVTCYNNANSAHYEELLHPDYTFYFQDVQDGGGGGKQFFTRSEDIALQQNMFNATRGAASDPALNLDKLTLTLTAGSWTSFDSLGGAQCNDCWTTQREYTVTIIFTGGQNGYTGNDLVELVVIPVEENGKKLYKLWRLTDIKQSG